MGAGAATAAANATEEKLEGKEELDKILEALFLAYDDDGDGRIERMELLDVEELRLGKGEFGPKVRKAIFNWFKEAGAEGKPTDGMYLSKEKWLPAIVQLAAEESGLEPKELAKIAEWLSENRLKPILAAKEASAPPPAPSSSAAGTSAPDLPSAEPLTY